MDSGTPPPPPLLEFNILSEIIVRLLSCSTSELKFNNVKLNFAESQKRDIINILCPNNINLMRKLISAAILLVLINFNYNKNCLLNEKLSNFYTKLCDEINISCPILKFTIPLLEFNILSEIIGRLLSSTSELKFNNVKLNFAESQKM